MKDETLFDIEEVKQSLYKKILSSHESNKKKINHLSELLDMKIADSENIQDAMLYVPKYSEVVEMMINNDQTLLKLFESLIKSSNNPKTKKIVEPVEAEPIDDDDDDDTFVSVHQDSDFEEVSKNLEKYER